MFVRWQVRQRHGWWQPGTCWSAILVESKRVNGKSKQEHIAYLGSINEAQLSIGPQVAYFWGKAWRILDRLNNRLSATERGKIEQSLAMKVPRITWDEYRDRLRIIARSYGFNALSEDCQADLKDEADTFQPTFKHVLRNEARKPVCALCGKKADRVIKRDHVVCFECIDDYARLKAEADAAIRSEQNAGSKEEAPPS
jgi:hypothetical protein